MFEFRSLFLLGSASEDGALPGAGLPSPASSPVMLRRVASYAGRATLIHPQPTPERVFAPAKASHPARPADRYPGRTGRVLFSRRSCRRRCRWLGWCHCLTGGVLDRLRLRVIAGRGGFEAGLPLAVKARGNLVVELRRRDPYGPRSTLNPPAFVAAGVNAATG